MSVFYDLSKTPRNILNQAIVRAIVSESNGAWFDPSDLSTLYQDAAGTIPVTAVEQPVGKMLDKSGNGYHATQSITASRPTLSARYNMLTKTEDFADAVWVKTGVTIQEYVLAPDGTPSACKIIESATTSSHTLQVAQAMSVGIRTSINLLIKAAGRNYALVSSGIADAISVNLITGNATAAVGSPTNITTTAVSGGWWLVSFGITAPQSTILNIYTSVDGVFSNRSYSGDGTSGVYIWHPDLRLGTTSSPYQRVNTATDYDTDERYFKKYLRFDGIDDYLNLPYMRLYSGGSASVVAGVYGHQFGKTRNGRVICESLVSSSLPTYTPCVDRYNIKTMSIYMANDTGTPFASIDMSLPQNSTNIISVIDSGNSVKSYQNAGQKVTSSYLRSGSVTLDSTTIGKGINNGSAEIWQGDLYGLIVTKSALSDAQRIKCERYTASKAGVTL